MISLTADEELEVERLCRSIQTDLNKLIPLVEQYILIDHVRSLEVAVIITEILEQCGTDALNRRTKTLVKSLN